MPEPTRRQNSADAKSALLQQVAARLELPAGRWDDAVAAQLDLLRAAILAAEEQTGSPARMAEVLRALGQLKRQLLTRAAAPFAEPPREAARLSAEWFDLADDGSWEFELAAAVAAIADPDLGRLSLPCLPSAAGTSAAQNKTGSPRHGKPYSGLASQWRRVLAARLEEGARQRLNRLPLGASRWASVAAVSAFLSATTEDQRIEDLVCGLLEADIPPPPRVAPAADPSGVAPPRAYALLKLAFLPAPVHGGQWPANPCASRVHIVEALGGGDLFRACWLAAKELQAAGFAVQARPAAQGASDPGWRDAALEPLRLAAALLVPISPWEARHLATCL